MLMREAFWNPNYDKYAITDVETTVNAPDGFKFPADPRYEGNAIVLGARMLSTSGTRYFSQSDIDAVDEPPESDVIIVGHHIKFDMQYLEKFAPKLAWDTGIAHYMLSGQKEKMPSLEDVAKHYGLGTKTVPMSLLWEVGFKTEDMDPDFLKEYLDGDIALTHAVYLKQLEATAKTPHIRRLILHCSTASLALGDAELTGLPLHFKGLTDLHDREVANADKLIKECKDLIRGRYAIPDTQEFDITPSLLGKALHGLPIELDSKEAAPRILKSGKVAKRLRTITTEYKSGPIGHRVPAICRTAGGAIRVDDDVLQEHADAGSLLAQNTQAIRSSQKLTSTYTGPAILYCTDTGFRCMHTKFNQTVTNTGRTSSQNPNVQNLPPEVEACIRAPAGQYLVKADFSQLQICGLAMLSGDEQLIADVNGGVDIHYETGKSVYSWDKPEDMEKATRRIVKNVNFGLIFGGTALGLAAQTGVEVDIIKELIKSFAKRYPKAYAYGKKLAEEVGERARPAVGEFIDGTQVREAFHCTPAGRLLRFVERKAPAWLVKKTHKPLSFSPNEIANYPVQGYCDGDLAVEFAAYMYIHGVRIVNLVHDAYWFLTDKPEELKMTVARLLKEFNDTLQLRVPLKLEFSVEDSDGNKVGTGH